MRLSPFLALIALLAGSLSATDAAWAGPAVSTGTGNERVSRGCLPERTAKEAPKDEADGELGAQDAEPENWRELVRRKECAPNDF